METRINSNGNVLNKGNRWKDKNKALSNPPDSNAFKAFNYFVEKGLTPEQSSGIVGNLAQESTINLDSSIENSIGAFGIAQWLGSRRTDLNKFAKDNNRQPDEFNLQLDFIWHELNTTEKRAFKALKQTNTPQAAAEVFVNKFERSGEKKGDKGFDRRVNYASQFYSQFNTNITPPPVSSSLEGISNNVLPNTNNSNNDFIQEYNQLLAKQEQDEVRRQDKIKSDVAKSKLEEKINQRNFLVDFVNNSDIAFIPQKREGVTQNVLQEGGIIDDIKKNLKK